jgi:hypothetical protein
VFLADQFSRLRELVCPDGEESFIRSLASCVQWAARGGKSGSTFCKTKGKYFVSKFTCSKWVFAFTILLQFKLSDLEIKHIVFDINAKKSEKFSSYQTKENFERGSVCTYLLLLQHT